jgi:ribosome-binding ATPase YchF (GTP1/OBG family)
MLFADLQMITNRLERVEKEPSSRVPGTPAFLDRNVLEKAQALLEGGEPIRKGIWSESERALLQSYSFLSAKPWVGVINTDESRLGETLQWDDVASGVPLVKVCAQCEIDLKGFSEKEREEFYQEWGVEIPPVHHLSRVIRDSAGLITFYTIEGDEARAWLVERGTTAHQAAGVIHTDLMRGFIRAEILPYREFETLGSVQGAAREHKWQVHGKDYILQDGDIMRVRHKS